MESNSDESLRELFLGKIQELEEEIRNLKEMTRPQGLDSAIGRVSRMDYINNKSINEAQILKIQKKIKGLQHWLGKLGTAAFGKCIRCGEPINHNRLLLVPESPHCIRCASRP
ncbi:TraR/DksA family transcriptional regulator [Cyclobacterium salsum]|uniref:TraR/DksA family transcriptional regulator n=1 Tax=Cyclobacterium salsum TaxID=2666329 RepID=UPI001390E083|nr:TraR/DksA C4-type zinc finger protein [Cyclobacterium salsum]